LTARGPARLDLAPLVTPVVDGTVLVPFVELEFTHGLGPPPGRYLVRGPGSTPPAPAPATGAAPALPIGSADVLLVRVDQAPAARSPLLRRSRPRQVEPGGPPAEVPVYVAALLFATRAFDERAGADAALARWRADAASAEPLVQEALAVLNRAVRAYRAAAAHPYVVEVTRADARAVRIGHGGADLVRGEWEDAVVLPAPQGSRLGRAARLRPTEIVADVLAGRGSILDGEDVLLRAVLDIEQGRPDAAAGQLELAIALLIGEPGGPGPALHEAGERSTRMREQLRDGHDREAALAELSAVAAEVGEAVDAWRAG
jgi:hypothetical protein